MYVTWLPKAIPEIRDLCLIFPILDYVACGKIPGEETTAGFMKAMNEVGYRHLYRGINRPVWTRHLTNRDGLCPMESQTHLQNTRIFIGHGKDDKNINSIHSNRYISLLQKRFPQQKNQFVFKEYSGDHSSITSRKIVKNYLKWINLL
jgi:hypothetical protein